MQKDKASVLASTREYLSSLKAQVEELSKRKQILEEQLLPTSRRESAMEEARSSLLSAGSSNLFEVGISRHPASASDDQQIVDLNVSVRGEASPMADIAIRILEFLKQVNNVSLVSMEANTRVAESGVSNHVTLRLRIEVYTNYHKITHIRFSIRV